MKKIVIGVFTIIICIVGVIVVFSQKPVSVKPDFDSETKESNATNEYDLLRVNGYDKLDDLFRDNKEIFVSAADLLLAKNSNGLMISYDFENDSVNDIFTDNNGFYSIKDSFTDAEQEILISCFDIMRSIMPSDTRCLLISTSERFSGSSTVDFMFRSNLDMDYGISFAENESDVVGEFSELENNWYRFLVGLV